MDLIISPHLDDEVLGCYSFLTNQAAVLYLTESHPLFPNRENVEESRRLEAMVGCQTIRERLPTNQVATVGESALIRIVEETLCLLQPSTVLLPFPSYNQDHRAIHECALTALRVHDRLPFVKRVLVYEEPDVWGTMRQAIFRPTYFRGIEIEGKLALWAVYKTQQRGHRTIEDIRTIAHTRGMQSHQPYAEAFEVLRWCE